MITSNHIEYLKQELEPEEGYPHKELYAFADKYLLWHDLLEKNKDDPGFAANPFCKWEDRYDSLVQRGTFFNNVITLQMLRYDAESEEAWKIALDLEGIREEVANFEICYCWMCPERWFSHDWRELDDPEIRSCFSFPPFSSEAEMIAWNFVRKRYKKIVEDHLPMCTFDEFVAVEL